MDSVDAYELIVIRYFHRVAFLLCHVNLQLFIYVAISLAHLAAEITPALSLQFKTF